jgi:uncharacterized protein (DUF488 family)
MATLFTIGYEQAALSDVIATLKRAKVQVLIDTRAVAASRRAGFSKKALSASLDEAGIAYLHFQKLGTPSEGREAARAGNYDKLWKIYGKHIKTRPAQEELAEVTSSSKRARKSVCSATSANRKNVIAVKLPSWW